MRPLPPRLLIAALLLTALLAPASARAELRLAPDKRLHFGASAGIAFGGSLLATAVTGESGAGVAFGFGLAMTAGVGKELYDLTGRGTPELADLGWDLAGALSGVATAWIIDRTLLAPLGARSRLTGWGL